MKTLSIEQMKRLYGGVDDQDGGGEGTGDNSCNVYCTSDASLCKTTCLFCVDGGNAGGKLCAMNP